jgi:hypothetical protein
LFKDLKVGDRIAQFGGSAEVLNIADFLVDGASCETTKRFTLLEHRDGTEPSVQERLVHLTTETTVIL